MSQSLGQLYVNLTAETGGFVSALSKAAYEAQKFSKEASRSFGELREVAEQTFGAFGEFNPAISKLAFSLETAGSAASKMMKELSGIGGAIGPIVALSGGAAVGLTSIGFAALGVAAEAAEAAAKMYQLAQSTGVPVSTLSALGFAARAAGVDVQQLALGLEKMSKSAFAAATAPAGAANAYTRLGVAVRDVAGNIRPAQDILLDLADKFSKMPDGVEKSADAIQIFGKSGDAMIPFLNKGKQGIADLIDYAERVGAVLSGQAAEAAEEFSINMTKVGIAAQGAQNALMVDLLPTLSYLSEMLAKTGADGRSWAQTTADSVANVAKFVLSAADTVIHFFEEVGIFFEFIGGVLLGTLELIGSVVTATYKALTFDFSGARNEIKAGLASFTSAFTNFYHETEKNAQDNVDFLNGVWGKLKPPELNMEGFTRFTLSHGTGAKQPPAPEASHQTDIVAELVEKLQGQAAAELALAAATEKSASASALAKAAAEAEMKIAETRAQLLAKEKNLREQLSDAKAGVGGGKVSGVQTLRLQAEISVVQKLLAELEKDTPLIKTLYTEIAGAKFGVTAAEDLEKFITKTDEETTALQKMAAAYQQGPLAAQQAAEGAKIAPFEKKRADLGEIVGGLTDKRDALQKAGGDPALIAQISGAIASLTKSYDELGGAIDRAKVSETAFVAAEISEKIAKEKALLASEAEGFRLVAAAALKSAADQREAAAEAAALKFGAEHPTATPAQLGEVRDTELSKLTEEREKTIAVAAAQFDLNASYSQELEKLQEIKAFLESQGQSTIAIDTKIYETRVSHLLDYQRQVFESDNQQLLGEQKIYEQAIQLTDAWDKAALEVGSLGDKFKAVSNEIQLEGQNLGEKLAENFKTAVDDMSGQLAKFIVTGKGSIRQFFDSLAENALKSTFQYSFSKLFAGITGAAGPGGAPGGVGPGGTAGTFPGPLGGVAGALGLKIPGAPGAIGAHAPSSVATMNIAAQVVNLSGSSTGLPGLGGAPSSTGGASDGSSAAPFYSIFTDSTGNPYGVGNALPIVPSGGGSPFTESLPITGADNQRAFSTSSILGLPGIPGLPGAPAGAPSLTSLFGLTSAASGGLGGVGGAKGTSTAPFYVIAAGASTLTSPLPFTATGNQPTFAAPSIYGLPGLPGAAGAPGANPSLLTSVAGGAGLAGANGTAGAPFYVVSALGPLGGLSSSSGSPLGGGLGSAPGQDTYGNAVFGAGAAAPGAPPAAGAAGGIIGTILKLFGVGASASSPGGGLGGAISGAGGGAAGAASSTAAATTMQAAATTMVTAATTMTTAAATMQAAATTMSASASSSGAGGGGGLLSLFGGGGADAAGGAGDLADLADLAAFASGGNVTKGVPYIVGEDRPEVFVPQEHGRIVRSIPDFENSSDGRAMKVAAQIHGDRAQHFASFDLSNLSHRESGGSVTAGVPYLAGEKRPEVFVPNSFSSSRAPRASGGDAHYHNTVNQYIQTPDVDSFAKSQDQLHAEAFAAMNRASYRSG